LQAKDVDHSPIVPECLQACRLVVGRDEREPTDLEQLWRGEEHHERREVEDRVDEHAFLDDDVVEAMLFCGNRRGQP
jgi:hypothetical protein